jgi:putative ABC transport system permease protein
MMMFQAVYVATVGALVGTAGLLALQNVIRSMLFEVSPADPLTLFAVVAVLAFATAAAVYIPARRSLKVDPATALRYE